MPETEIQRLQRERQAQARAAKRREHFAPERMYTMWACVSERGYYLVAFRTKKAAQHEKVHYRPETRIERIEVRTVEPKP